jgi:hypothetical protein
MDGKGIPGGGILLGLGLMNASGRDKQGRMRFVVLISMLLALCACSTVDKKNQTRSLWNGRDLSGWVVMHGGEWTVEDGALVGRNGTNWSTNPEASGSWLRTEREYDDFVLELEYAISPRGNSGIHFRSGLERNPTFNGYEMQIVDDAGREPRKGSTGAIYDVIAANKNMSKPAGEWNQVRITCQGPRIQINLNGEDIVDHVGDRRTRGYIGLQNHDARCFVKFRNIRLREL